MKLSKETQEVVTKLQKEGKKVFVNAIGEIFTQESYAKASGEEYEEVKKSIEDKESGGSKAPASEKAFNKMNKAELEAAAKEKNIQIPEGSTNKDIAALLETSIPPDGAAGNGGKE